MVSANSAPDSGEPEGSGELEAGRTVLAKEGLAMDERGGPSGQWSLHEQRFPSKWSESVKCVWAGHRPTCRTAGSPCVPSKGAPLPLSYS